MVHLADGYAGVGDDEWDELAGSGDQAAEVRRKSE